MEAKIKDVHYGGYAINKIYYGDNLIFNRLIYDLNQNVYVFDLSKVVGNLTLTLQDVNSGEFTSWGDGTIDTSLTHTYESQGIYIVKTRQLINSITTGNGNINTRKSLTKCININNTITNCYSMFTGCSSLTTAPVIPSSVTWCSYMFTGCSSLTTAPVIPSSVTGCSVMFYNCSSLTIIPQLNIDLMEAVKNGTNTTCTDYINCYYGCTNITTPQNYATLSGLYPNWFN